MGPERGMAAFHHSGSGEGLQGEWVWRRTVARYYAR
jgi:hypothetical protein